MKKILSIILMLCIILSLMTACGGNIDTASSSSSDTASEVDTYVYSNPTQTLKATASNDKYRNIYEILLYTFCDSNGDEIGDIQGLISKLDYLNDGDPNSGDDLGVDAIWLLPFTVADSYHKYDTVDHYSIDDEYGTMDDFKELVSECHARGINIIMDLVLNHTSSQHPWFTKACEEIKQGKTDGYAEMYSLVNSEDKPAYFAGVYGAENWWYECNFMPSFPELNLSSEKTREEISNIVKHWTEIGVDGFRLDAVKYFTSSSDLSTDKTDGEEFLKWFTERARGHNPNAYVVGELWDSSTLIKTHYKSGIDSLFNFDGSGSTGKYANALQTNDVYRLVSSMKRYSDSVIERNPEFIDAVFLSNHDQMRIGTTLTTNVERKLAAALYMLTPGNSFIYYGEELGLAGSIETQDASFRTAMIWTKDGKDGQTGPPPGYETPNIPDGGGVAEQLADSNSLLNFYRRVIRVKNQNPEIARGYVTETINFDDTKQAGYVVEYNGTKKVVLHNIADSEVTLTLSENILDSITLYGDLYAADNANPDNYVEINGKEITLPGYSTAILG